MTSLLDAHDALLVDLDGTLFRGGTVLPGAVDVLSRAASRGLRIGYLTNNGARSPGAVAEHLAELGFTATGTDVVTSGEAAGRLLAERLPDEAHVLVVGTADLREQVRRSGLTVTSRAEDADAVVQGHSPDVEWSELAEACLAIRAGALWVACNVDLTLPTERGELPGNGSMVAALRAATDAEPLVAGKPQPWVFTEAVRRTSAQRPLVIGDRLETDIAGANAAGLTALAVLTGVSGAAAILRAPSAQRPHYIGSDLRVLDEKAEKAVVAARPPWKVRSERSGLVLTAEGDGASDDPVAALRALCEVHWASDGGPVKVRAEDDASASALESLGLRPD